MTLASSLSKYRVEDDSYSRLARNVVEEDIVVKPDRRNQNG
jgi:hypothetical protein